MPCCISVTTTRERIIFSGNVVYLGVIKSTKNPDLLQNRARVQNLFNVKILFSLRKIVISY